MDFNGSLRARAERLKRFDITVPGKSVSGREIFIITAGSGNKRLFLCGGYHANEWITSLFLIKYAEELHKKKIPENVRIDILPLVNPDGASLVLGELKKEEYKKASDIAKRYPDIPFPGGWKANIRGVDLNLNFPAGWEMAVENKKKIGINSKAPRDFPGREPLSEPETKIIADHTRMMGFDMVMAFHTQGRVIYSGYCGVDPAAESGMLEEMSEASGYEVECAPEESGYAGYKDWFIKEYNKPGFTIEAGQGVNPLPLDCFDEIYKECSAITDIAIKYLNL